MEAIQNTVSTICRACCKAVDAADASRAAACRLLSEPSWENLRGWYEQNSGGMGTHQLAGKACSKSSA